MPGVLEVLRRMLADAGVAATHVPTHEALAEMHPVRAKFQALHTTIAGTLHPFDDLPHMLTGHPAPQGAAT
jgi:hypothetical protein